MKHITSSILMLGCLLTLQFCAKDNQSNYFSDKETDSKESSNQSVTERTDCGCELKVVANMAGGSGGNPWIFEMTYIQPNGTPAVAQVFANGTTWTHLTIKEGTTQTWEFLGGDNTSTINVTVTLSCTNDGCKICGPSKNYIVPANTPEFGYYDLSTTTDDDCDVE